MSRLGAYVVASVMLWAGMSARADVTFDSSTFGNNVALPTVKSFAKLGVSLTASGFNSTITGSGSGSVLTIGTATAMFAKNDGGPGAAESGLGIDKDSDNEINPVSTIKLDFGATRITGLTIGSI